MRTERREDSELLPGDRGRAASALQRLEKAREGIVPWRFQKEPALQTHLDFGCLEL